VKDLAVAIVWSAVSLGTLAAVLFGSAGTLAIASFWVYVGIVVAVTIAGLFLVDPDLMRERARPGGKPPGLWALWLTALMIAHFAVAGFDRGRWHLTDSVPAALQAVALIAFAAANSMFLWAMHVNRFFSSVARIQPERGHRVVSDGPYRFVRHPGYTAGLVMTVASGLALGSWLATLIGLIGIPLLLRRIRFEDDLLREQLAGYADYAARVRYRLLPYVW
jgi:protein-S-isoprenylcysteine O-methyltransferase Ste14